MTNSFISLGATLSLFCATALAQNTSVPWYSLGGSFGPSVLANSKVLTAMGQQFVGNSSGGPTMVQSGFLAGVWRERVLTSVEQLSSGADIPREYTLAQNYPNPFNPASTIKYEIPEGGRVRLQVFDILGRRVTTLVDEHKEPGHYAAQFNAFEQASGTYFYRIIAGPFIQVKKMLLTR